jgi:cytidine deaminase
MLTNQKIDAALAELEESEKAQLISELKDPEFSGQINSVGMERVENLLKLATCFSVAPISGFYVGAIAIGKSGKLYLGANIEFQGVPLSASLHAEQSAILNAWMHEEREVVVLHVSETPCGHCRQFMRELSNPSTLKIHCKGQTYQIEDLLPLAFGENRQKGHGLLDSTGTNLEPEKTKPETQAQLAINAAQLYSLQSLTRGLRRPVPRWTFLLWSGSREYRFQPKRSWSRRGTQPAKPIVQTKCRYHCLHTDEADDCDEQSTTAG